MQEGQTKRRRQARLDLCQSEVFRRAMEYAVRRDGPGLTAFACRQSSVSDDVRWLLETQFSDVRKTKSIRAVGTSLIFLLTKHYLLSILFILPTNPFLHAHFVVVAVNPSPCKSLSTTSECVHHSRAAGGAAGV